MSQEKIPILDLHPEIEALWPELNEAFQRVIRSTAFINGPDVALFEREVADYIGVKYAVGLNSGTDALFIALHALGIGPGDEVITSAFTFFATAEAISHVGATPVFVDIDPVTFALNPALIEAKITARTKAIIPVHLYGHAAAMDKIMELAGRHGLKVIEDVAQACGASLRGRKLGTFGDVGAFSFFPSKNLGAYGDGGMLVTNSTTLAESARMLRSHGSKKKYFNEVLGYNSRLDTLQAAILRVKLPWLDRWNEARRNVARRYASLLSGIAGLTLPSEQTGAFHVYHQYTVRVGSGRRDALQAALQAKGIGTMVYYPVPLHELPYYKGQTCSAVSLPATDSATRDVLSLPIWPQMPLDVQTVVAEAIRAFFLS